MKVGEFLKQTVIKGGPAAIALALGSPEAAAVLAASSVAADGVKYAGKAVEQKSGWRPHKVASPAAAVVGSAVAVQFVDPALPERICAIASQLCADPAALATIPGLVMVLWQMAASGAFKVRPEGGGPGAG